MLVLLLLLIPLITGLGVFAFKNDRQVKTISLVSATATTIIALLLVFNKATIIYDASWLPSLGARFTLRADGMAKILCLLTAIAYPLIFVTIHDRNYKSSATFYGLMLLTQVGLMGVFLAADALLFYFFWELALIPVYFLCSIWGGEKRIAVTFKFFIYTFVGSLLMLTGLLYLYFHTVDQSFAWESFKAISLNGKEQAAVFALLFIAFAIKMPIFPFHTWQPDAYEQSPTAVTMVLSAIMVKMGIYAVLRWLIPVVPMAASQHAHMVITLSVIGMVYASLIAIKQDDVKRLIAYSSIAHIGLMSAAMFTNNTAATSGVMIQMFNHGINVLGLWIVAEVIEQQLGTRKLSELGGLAQKAPAMAILLVVLSLANIALPLTNAFVGEFLMFNGLFQYNVWMMAVAGTSIILAAVYTLNMVQKVIYGELNTITANAIDISGNVKLVLVLIVLMIVAFGIFPQYLIELVK
jgi:NADH-quinone oxidoreductase subunit M